MDQFSTFKARRVTLTSLFSFFLLAFLQGNPHQKRISSINQYGKGKPEKMGMRAEQALHRRGNMQDPLT